MRPKLKLFQVLLAFAFFADAGAVSVGQDEAEQEVEIADNSFLVEEAFNQEPGIVQHIFNWVPSWDWNDPDTRAFDFVFTQEWPVGSQTHQFSYTLPLSHFSERGGGQLLAESDGIGDMLLNYRLQVWDGEDATLAFSPRFSVILPTGDEDLGLGNGEAGYQINLPFSKQMEDRAFHFNAGLTFTPDVTVGVDPTLLFPGRTLNGYNLGGSAIRFVRPNFHLMLEVLALWDEELQLDGTEDHTVEVLLSPGFRWAPYTQGDTQLVLGTGLPIGLTEDAPDIALFLYMSFEHRFRRECQAACAE
jgi:hypothetical protein